MIELIDIQKEDASQLSDLDNICFSVPWSLRQFQNEAKNPMAHYVIAKIDGVIVGYAGYWKVIDEGQITNVAVLPQYRRKGIARTIIKKLINDAKEDGIKKLSLEVRCSNEAAISLYGSFGFIKVGDRKNYYHNPLEDALLFDLDIK